MSMTQARKHLLILLGLMLVSTIPFWLFPLDIQISSYFYHPELGAGDAAWPVQNLPFVQFCYKFNFVATVCDRQKVKVQTLR